MASFKDTKLFFIFLIITYINFLNSEDPYRFFDWKVTYGDIYPLGICQQVILINGQFPGPEIYSQTNDNIIINVYNGLTEPFLITWNGVQLRGNSWQDGVSGTNCAIPPNKNYTYAMRFKDQIGSFFYFPPLGFQKAAGGYGGISILSRPGVPVPFPDPVKEYTLLIGDWYKTTIHSILKENSDSDMELPFPDAILINGHGSLDGTSFTVDQGKTYRFRISNVGLMTSLNIQFQSHRMKLVEVEGTHTIQNYYPSFDVHVGQSISVLVAADQLPKDYYIAVSTRFATTTLTAAAILHYSNSEEKALGPIPTGPTEQFDWSMNQARTIRTNLSASGPRPNPQGSYPYGSIPVTRTIQLANSAAVVGGKPRYAVNSVSFVEADTPLKLADHFKIDGVFRLGSIDDRPTGAAVHLDTAVMAADFRAFVEVVFENEEPTVQSWHMDGYSFWVVGMEKGTWSPASRNDYNLNDAVSRCTAQVYPNSWTAVYVALDNVGMWNVRSQSWERRYLGQQFYLRVYSPAESRRDEYPMPDNALLCGRAAKELSAKRSSGSGSGSGSVNISVFQELE